MFGKGNDEIANPIATKDIKGIILLKKYLNRSFFTNFKMKKD